MDKASHARLRDLTALTTPHGPRGLLNQPGIGTAPPGRVTAETVRAAIDAVRRDNTPKR